MLDESDILNLIRLNELELRKTYLELESPDEDVRNNAGEIVLQAESLSKKLRQLYEDAASDYDIYPKYDEYIKRIK